jgi:5-methylcytosine-specific restriction protein A
MARRVSREAMRQRQGMAKLSPLAIELQDPPGVGGAEPKASTRAPRSPNASTRRWRNLRARKLEANPVCELKLPGCEGAAVEVDHIRQLAAGGDRFDWANLRSACEACHDKRHGKRKRRPRIKGCDADGYPLDPDHPWNKEK